MRVRELMTTAVETIAPDAPAVEAWELMHLKNIHHLVVKDGEGIVGIMSSRDAGGSRGGVLRQRSRVADLMTRSVVTVTPDMTIRRVASLMEGRSIGCLPVLENGRLAGIVTVSDLLHLLGRGVDRANQPTRHGLNHRVPHRKQRNASGMW